MTLLFTLLTLAVLGVIAAVATGRIAGGLEEPSTSLAPRGLPEGPVSAESLDAVRFSPALRGYRMEEVDAVLDRMGGELARRDRQILQLSQELRLAERAYIQRAARGAANPEWVAPTTGSLALTGSLPVGGAAPAGAGYGVNGNQEPGGQVYGEPAPSYAEQGFAGYGSQSYASQGYGSPDYPGQGYGSPDHPGQGYGSPDYPGQGYGSPDHPGQEYAPAAYPVQGHAVQGHPRQDHPSAPGHPGETDPPAWDRPDEGGHADGPDHRER